MITSLLRQNDVIIASRGAYGHLPHVPIHAIAIFPNSRMQQTTGSTLASDFVH